MAVKCCEHSSTYIFDQIFFILSCNKDSHEIWMSSNFGKIRPWTADLAALECLKKSPFTYNGKAVVNAPAPSFLMGSSSFLHATRTAIRSRMNSKFSEFRPWTAELPALECLKNRYLVLWPL